MPYLTTSPIGTAGGLVAGVVAKFDVPDSTKLAKTMFELSRDTDMTTHFDPDVHTLKAIAAGLPGHVALSCREVAEEDLTYHLSGVCKCGHCDESTNNDPEHGCCCNTNCHDRYFRDACEDTGKKVVVNMGKARAIKLAKIRASRNAELVKLDLDSLVAIEAGDSSEQARVSGLKQTLRDIPATFDLDKLKTPEVLKGAWPSELPAEE
tara:strand:- start:230 stop:853 length:624 start_codon:yes stop_codon:yes gene_type:complete